MTASTTSTPWERGIAAMTHAQSKVLFFKTSTCAACRKMEPFIENYDVEIVNLTFEGNRGMLHKYGLHSVPTTIKVDANGVELERHTGAMSEADFAKFVA